MSSIRCVAAALAVVALAACSHGTDATAPTTRLSTQLTTAATTTAPTTSRPAPPSTTAPPTFTWKAVPIDAAVQARMATSWRPGCPVPLDALRYVTLTYWGFDGAVHDGELVVHADAVDALATAFSALFDQRFPIRSIRLVDDFGGSDDRSMAADNTSAFNCRPVAGSSRWSQHAYGRAVDINPVENPYLHGGVVDPPEGGSFLDRSDVRPGMLVAGSPAVRAFTDVGWGWGGSWRSPDLQHVSASGS